MFIQVHEINDATEKYARTIAKGHPEEVAREWGVRDEKQLENYILRDHEGSTIVPFKARGRVRLSCSRNSLFSLIRSRRLKA